jgi:adenosylmethionine-8-amino-7-oxononanoate aminotransferase
MAEIAPVGGTEDGPAPGPGPTHDGWVARDAAVVWHGFTQMASYADNQPVIVDRAEGHEVIDVDGNRYLDAISSLWVTTVGHRVPELDDAVRAQLDKVAHTTLLGNGNAATIELAEALAPRVPVDDPHFLFASDGAAATEQALKIAFQHWVNEGVTGRTSYLALGGAYHGDTTGAISLGAGGFGTELFDPLRFSVHRAPGYDDPQWDDLAVKIIDRDRDSLAAVVLEPLVQGAAGIEVTDPARVKRVVDAARAAGVVVIVDEVATGFGRTGTLFASEQCDIRADILCLGKGLTGGYLPMSATVVTGTVYRSFLGADLGERTFYHGHSFSGNALASAVALRHLRLLDEQDVLANVGDRATQLGELLDRHIASRRGVRAVRRRGLMTGVELAPPADGLKWGRRVCAAAVRRGVLLRPLGDVIVLMPLLTSTPDEITRIVETLRDAILEVTDDSAAADPSGTAADG